MDLSAAVAGNPFQAVELDATFSIGNRSLRVDGFYDGGDSFKLRFMPDCEGEWRYVSRSNIPDLNDVRGTFACVAPSQENHGPVRVVDPYHFAYEDGSAYHPLGTTCYVWNLQGDELEEQTLKTLAAAPSTRCACAYFPSATSSTATNLQTILLRASYRRSGIRRSWAIIARQARPIAGISPASIQSTFSI